MAAGGLPAHPHQRLRGVWAKIGRAREHQVALEAAASDYLASRPWREDEHEDDGRRVIRATVTQQPSLRLGVLLGDIVHNARSALDHLVWAFQPPGVEERDSQFPILDTPPNGGLRRHRYTAQLPDGFLSMLGDLQPYQPEGTTQGQIGRELRLLRDLSNADKHRVLAVVAGVVLPGHVFHNTPEGTDSGVAFQLSADWQQAEIHLPSNSPHGPFHYAFDAQVHVAEPGVGQGSSLVAVAREVTWVAEEVVAGSRAFWSELPSDPTGD